MERPNNLGSPSSTTMLHYPRNLHVTVTTHVNYPNTAAEVTRDWMHRTCRKGIEDYNTALERRSLSRFADWNLPRPNIINYPRLLHEGQAIIIGAAKRKELVASRVVHHRTDTFGVKVSADVTMVLINSNPDTKILDKEKEAVMAAASSMPAAALVNVVSCFGSSCQLGTCAVGLAVYLMIPLRDSNDIVVKPVPPGDVRDITTLNLKANGQGTYSTGQDAHSTGQDAHSLGTSKNALGTSKYALGTSKFALGTSKHALGTSVRHQPGYVETRKNIPCKGCDWRHNQNHIPKPRCPTYDNKRR